VLVHLLHFQILATILVTLFDLDSNYPHFVPDYLQGLIELVFSFVYQAIFSDVHSKRIGFFVLVSFLKVFCHN